MLKRIVKLSLKFVIYIYDKLMLIRIKPKFSIMTNEETLKQILNTQCSVVRYGDGELMYINGTELKFQKKNDLLSNRLKNILHNKDKSILICLPEPLVSCENLVLKSKMYWTHIKVYHHKIYNPLFENNEMYGNSFISRPYLVYKDKKNASTIFSNLKKLWDKKNVLIIEGEFSRSGMGNNLFSNANIIYRILCPSKNAFDYYEQIYEFSKRKASEIENLIILVAIGPTAKPLVEDLNKDGFWVIDIGHLDSEYEWFLQGVKKRVVIQGKHTAELGDISVNNCHDKDYIDSIIGRIGVAINEE